MTTPTKLYKRALFEGVRYPVGKLYEDIPVAYEVTKRAHKAAHIANRDYYYFQRGSSIQNMAFNPRKLDSVRHCHALMENVKRDFPQLSRAAECRYLSNVCNILFQIQDRQHEKIEKALWQEVKKYRRNVLLDPQARKKARLAAALSYSGYAMTRRSMKKRNGVEKSKVEGSGWRKENRLYRSLCRSIMFIRICGTVCRACRRRVTRTGSCFW